MNNNLILDLSKRVILISIIIIVLMAILFSNPKPIILGYFFGTLISVISFQSLINTTSKAVVKSPSRAMSYTTLHYTIRLIIYGLTLFTAAEANYLNVWSTAFGLTMIKNTIVLSTIFDKSFNR